MMESVSPSHSKKWSAIVLTCQNKRSAYAFQKELDIHKSEGFIDADVLTLVLEDPKDRVGSGGATLNALMVVTEHLSAQAGYVTLTPSVLEDANILIVHMGRDYLFSPCGRAFTYLPAKYTNKPMTTLCDGLVSTLECLFYILSDIISPDSSPGVWACSTDMLLSVSPSTKVDWEQCSSGITMFVVPVDKDYASLNGVTKLGAQGEVEDIIYRGTEQDMDRCALRDGKVPTVSGVVFFSAAVADKMLVLHAFPPLDACTYYGLDNGAPPIQLSLFFDILLCMAKSVSENDFICGKRSGAYGRSTCSGTEKVSEKDQMFMRGARALLWQHLRGIHLRAVVFENANFDYMDQSGVCYRRQMLQSAEFTSFSGLRCSAAKRTHVYAKKGGTSSLPFIDDGAIVLNCILEGGVNIGRDSVVTHCHLNGDWSLGSGMIISGIGPSDLEALPRNLKLPNDLCILGFNVSLPSLGGNVRKILVVLGVQDKLELAASSNGTTFCNRPWKEFFDETGINSDELWVHGLSEEKRNLYNARLFPIIYPFENMAEQLPGTDLFWLVSSNVEQVTPLQLQRWRSSLRFSMKEILSVVNLSAEFGWKRQLWFQIGKQEVESSLHGCKNKCHLPFFRSCTKEGFEKEILETLDKVICTTSSPGVAARTLACVGDVLGAMAGEKAGLRSGPARNEAWMKAFRHLENKNLLTGVKALADERSRWLARPDLLIRAARHYEGAEQILRRHAVMTAREFVSVQQCEPIPVGHWVIAEAPARADLAGGWTDTPPVTYEHGGSVVNVAIKLNGKRPVVAKVRKIPEFEIRLVIQTKEHSVQVMCKELSDLANYTQPHAPGALLKACFCVVDIVTFPSDQSLAEQLKERYNAGFELFTLSDNIPRGSGLGTSSILAGVILGAILRAAGRTASVDSLIHAVLLVEQMLTTAGGWQDNVGGLVPGFKICRAQASLPLKVETQKLDVSPAVIEDFFKRLVFVYTGKTRLAKNLLQDVVRNWYARLPEITRNADQLQENAEEAAKALVKGDLEKFGKCLNNYRHQKRTMAPGTEPDEIAKMMKRVEPYCYGQALAGAGGGGFLYILVKEPGMVEKVKSVLQGMEFYDVSIDFEGLTVRVEEP